MEGVVPTKLQVARGDATLEAGFTEPVSIFFETQRISYAMCSSGSNHTDLVWRMQEWNAEREA
jgi:hypothetical protein